MLRPKKGCPEPGDVTDPSGYPVHYRQDVDGDKINVCATGKHSWFQWADERRTEWNVAVAFDSVEM